MTPICLLWLGRACLQIPGRRDEAVQCLRRCIALKPDLAEAVEGLGDLLQDEGRLDEAIELYGAALRATPGSAKLLNGWAAR